MIFLFFVRFLFLVNHQAKYRLKKKKKKGKQKKAKNELIFYIFTRVNKLNVAQVCRPGMGGGRRGRAGRSAAGDPPGRSVGIPRRIKIPVEGKTRKKRGGEATWMALMLPGRGAGGRTRPACRAAPHSPTPGPPTPSPDGWVHGGREGGQPPLPKISVGTS